MPYEFKLPDLGEGIHEGEIKKWLVKEGDEVKSDQPIAQLETDKAVVEMPSPKAGKILKLHAKEGEIVKVGSTLVTYAIPGEKLVEAEPHETVGQKAEKEPQKQPTIEIPANAAHVLATPYIRAKARELGLDITKITGTGPGGRITEDDLTKAPGEKPVGQPKPQKVPIILGGEVERVPFKGVRRKIAERMVTSMTTAMHVTHAEEVDVTDLYVVRKKENEKIGVRGEHLTFLPFIIKAAVIALKKFPFLNSSLDEEKQEIILKKYYNIGIAVDTDDGLMVPVIKNTQTKSMVDISKEIRELAEKAKSRTIALDDLRGGTFSITNVGSVGGIFATPIINYPEVAILAVYAIKDKPAVFNGKIEIRKIMNLSITFDHRVIDGSEAAEFMNVIKQHLEDPNLLLVDE